jgi:hypothetical protein
VAISGYVTLDDAKDQVSIERDFDGHDDRLERLIAAAEWWAINFLNIDSLDDVLDSPADSPAEIPDDVKSAILLHLEAEFDRDTQNFELLLKRAHDMLWPYRINLGV